MSNILLKYKMSNIQIFQKKLLGVFLKTTLKNADFINNQISR